MEAPARTRSSTCCSVEIANRTEARSPVPTRRPADLGGGGGMGLNLVDTLASRWGVRSIPSTAVWFELDC